MVQCSNSSKIMEAANHSKNSAMEAENHVKHETSSKNHKTKKGVFVKKVLIPIVVAVIAGLIIWFITGNKTGVIINGNDNTVIENSTNVNYKNKR